MTDNIVSDEGHARTGLLAKPDQSTPIDRRAGHSTLMLAQLTIKARELQHYRALRRPLRLPSTPIYSRGSKMPLIFRTLN